MWNFNDNLLPSNTIVSKNGLFIGTITLDNEGIYTCKGVNKYGEIFYANGTLFVICELIR